MNYSVTFSTQAKSAKSDIGSKISAETLKKMQEIAAWNQRKREVSR